MYPVSELYKYAMRKPVQRRRLRGLLDEVPFTEDNILMGSLSVTNQMSESSSVSIGGVFVGQLKCTFLSNMQIARGSWNKKVISVTDELHLSGDVWEGVPLGIYTISEAIWSAEGISVTAYDNMVKFDKRCDLDTTVGSMYVLLNLACQKCDVELGMTQEEVEALPNGSEQLGLYPENDVETWRDFISWLAQTACSFATIDREGRLILKVFGFNQVDSIPPRLRFVGGQFSDFSTFYTGISIVNMESQTTSYYSVKPDNGLVMNLGSNPFLQYGLKETLDRQRKAILNQLTTYDCVPFTIEMLGDPSYELGDLILFEDGIADDSLGCLMFYEYQYGNMYSIAGYGEDPALQSNKSKTDKVIAGLSSKTEGNKVTYYQYTNAEALTIGEADTKIASIRFATEKTTDVDIWSEFKVNTLKNEESDRIVGTVSYLLNGQLIDYQPVETWAIDGYHVLNLNYHIQDVENTSTNVWEVFLNLVGGSGEIDVGDATVVLGGQGMEATEEWDGIIEIEEPIKNHDIKSLETLSFAAQANINIINDNKLILSDDLPDQLIKSLSSDDYSANLYLSFQIIDYMPRVSSMPEIYSGDIGLL